MDISQVAKASGFPSSTLRYYEKIGLIQSCGRKGLKRVFTDKVLQRLALISLGQKAGLSLQEIASMFTAEGANINRQLLMDKADELDQQIKQLTTMRNGLRHAAECKAPSHFECPTFLRLLRLAATDKKH